jgi:hypothetical protein
MGREKVMMRYGVITIFLVLLGSVMILSAQDFDATATAIVQGATQTAIAEANRPQAQVTQDPFQLTATELVRAATQTAEAFTGQTAVPITANAQGQSDFELTATALVEAATAQASGNFGTGDEPPTEEETNSSAMGGTVFIFIGLLVGLVALGVIVVTVGRRTTGKNG